MCLPLAAAGGASALSSFMSAMAAAQLAVSTVSAVGQYRGQKQQFNSQSDAIRREAALERMDSERQAFQEAQEAAGEANEHARQTRSEMASLDAILGEFGGGATAVRKQASFGIQSGQNLATIQDNARKVQSEIGWSNLARESTSQSRLASLQRPSSAHLGLTIAGAGARYGLAKAEADRYMPPDAKNKL
jgi:hypothetical protein